MNAELDPLAFYKARSFWLIVSAIVVALLNKFGVDLLAQLGLSSLDQLVSLLQDFGPELITGLIALAARERINPKRRLALRG